MVILEVVFMYSLPPIRGLRAKARKLPLLPLLAPRRRSDAPSLIHRGWLLIQLLDISRHVAPGLGHKKTEALSKRRRRLLS
jgi:hypothetical protein